jgi:hypothetical protein
MEGSRGSAAELVKMYLSRNIAVVEIFITVKVTIGE